MVEVAPAGAQAGAGPRRFLTFRIEDRLYALPSGEVAEVIRLPAVARLPHSPVGLMGLANLRGAVAPVVSLRRVLGRDDSGGAVGSRAIVLQGANPVVLTVDAVDALVAVDADQVAAQSDLSTEAGETLQGAFRSHGEAVAKILDVRAMLERAFGAATRPARAAHVARRTLAAHEAAAAAEAPAQRLVTFEVAGQDYALALEAVREIILAPEAVAVVPRAESVLLGVSSYRDALLPLLSLRSLLGFPPGDDADTARRRVIVVAVGGVLVGLVADRMRAILQADAARLEPTPAMLEARTGAEARIKAIYRGEDGRLVAVLSPEQLFREDVMQRLGEAAADPAAAADADAGETLQILVFRLGDEEFGLPIGAVDEVARVPERITRVPRTPEFLEGVVNLRGEVLPVVDQRRRFDLPRLDRHEGQRLVVVRTERHRAGLIVDSVSEVLRASPLAVEPAPDLTGDVARLVDGVLNLAAKGRMILLLDPAELLSRTERGLLDAFETGTDRQAAP